MLEFINNIVRSNTLPVSENKPVASTLLQIVSRIFGCHSEPVEKKSEVTPWVQSFESNRETIKSFEEMTQEIETGIKREDLAVIAFYGDNRKTPLHTTLTPCSPTGVATLKDWANYQNSSQANQTEMSRFQEKLAQDSCIDYVGRGSDLDTLKIEGKIEYRGIGAEKRAVKMGNFSTSLLPTVSSLSKE